MARLGRSFPIQPITVQNLPAGVGEAGSTPVVTANTATVTTASFTPTANALVVALCAFGNGAAAATTPGAVTDSAGSTWTRLAGENSANGGEAEVWCCDAGSSPTARTVTWDPGGSGASGLLLAVRWYAGAGLTAQQTGTTAVNGGTATPTKAIVTTVTGSLVVGTFATASGSFSLTANAATTLLGQFNGSSGDTAAAYRATSTTGVPGSITLGFTTVTAGAVDRMALAEILPAATGTSFTRTVDDTAGLTDAAAATAAFERTVTDTVGLVDTATTVSAFARTQDDPAGLADSAATATAFARTVDDGAGLTDSATTQLFSGFVRTVDDSAGLTDSVSQAVAFAVTLTDGMGLADGLALGITATVNDAAGLTDTVGIARAVTVTDAVGLTDSATPQLAAGGTRQVDDQMSLTDTVTYSSTQTLTDTAGLTDTASAVLTAARSVTDSVGLTDAVTAVLSRQVTVSDSMGLSDAASTQLSTGTAHVRTITDSMGLTSWHRAVQTTLRPDVGVTARPNIGVTARTSAGVTPRYPLVPD